MFQWRHGGTGGRKNRKGSSQPIPVNAGDVLKDAKVQSALSWGAFIDVGNGHQGLLHVDEMVTPEGVAASSAFDIVKEGQVLEVSLADALLLAVCPVTHNSSVTHYLRNAAWLKPHDGSLLCD